MHRSSLYRLPSRLAGMLLALAGLAACASAAAIAPGAAAPPAPLTIAQAGGYADLLGRAETLYRGEQYQRAMEEFRRAAAAAQGRDNIAFNSANQRAVAAWCMAQGQISRAAVQRGDSTTARERISAILAEPGCDQVPKERAWAESMSGILGLRPEGERP